MAERDGAPFSFACVCGAEGWACVCGEGVGRAVYKGGGRRVKGVMVKGRGWR